MPFTNPKSNVQSKSKTSKTRIDRPGPSLIVIISSLLFLVSSLLAFSNGLYGVFKVFQPQLDTEELRLKYELGLIAKEETLYSKVNQLYHKKLSRKNVEAYEQCLIRGLTFADAQFLPFEFTEISEIRNMTISWVEDACSEYIFTPQVYRPRSRLIEMTSWDRAVKVASKVLKATGRIKNWVRSKCWSKKPAADKASEDGQASTRDNQVILPKHFRLEGLDRPRLIYDRPTNYISPIRPVSAESMSAIKTRIASLEYIIISTKKAIYISEILLIIIEPTGLCLMATVVFYMDLPAITPIATSTSRGLRPLEKEFYLWSIAYTLMHFIDAAIRHHGLTHIPTMFLFALNVVGLTNVGMWLIPQNLLPNICEIIQAFRDLVRNWNEDNTSKLTTASSVTKSYSVACDVEETKPSHRIVPSTTTFQEDFTKAISELRSGSNISSTGTSSSQSLKAPG